MKIFKRKGLTEEQIYTAFQKAKKLIASAKNDQKDFVARWLSLLNVEANNMIDRNNYREHDGPFGGIWGIIGASMGLKSTFESKFNCRFIGEENSIRVKNER